LRGEIKPYKHSDFIKFFLEGETADFEVFSEMRGNVQLVAGDHYNRKRYNLTRRIQDFRDLSDVQKIRITKNHIQKICQAYEDAILAVAPGVGFEPKKKDELQDQKAAELHHAVWLDGEQRYSFEEEEQNYIEDFIEVGEECCKIFYDPMDGEILGHYSLVDPATGQDTGEPDLARPVYKGAILIEAIEGYNVVRPVECRRIERAEWLALKKMVNKDTMFAKFQSDDQRKYITTSTDQTYNVFDAAYGGYRKTEKECFLIEMYFRPSPRYPQGWYVYMTKEGILEEGELPGGIFPIIIQPCNRIHGSPRGRSPIKTMRPFQIEINRCASKMAEHHVTVGDDKIILANGSKASPGISMPGVRTVNVTGAPPQIMAGRDGSQFLAVANSTVAELYGIMGVPENWEKSSEGATDPYMMLFRSAKQKEPHNRRVRKHAIFKKKVVSTYLKLAKIHLPDEAVIAAVGKNEAINISEFKNANDLNYEIKVSDQINDVETKLGQQIMFSHVLQYAGARFTPDQLGMLIRQMPYSNGVAALSDLTMDYDSATNAILALDRGQQPPVHPYDNHPYHIKRLAKRMSEPSFMLLRQEVQRAYQEKINVHQQFVAYDAQMKMRMEQGLIPTTGPMVVMDYYVSDPENPEKTVRLKLPSDTIRWVLKQVETQGTMTNSLAMLPEGAQTQVEEKILQGGMQPMQGPQTPGMQPPNEGNVRPNVQRPHLA